MSTGRGPLAGTTTPRQATARRVPIVEVIGPAGCGKTAVCALVREVLDRDAGRDGPQLHVPRISEAAPCAESRIAGRTRTRTLTLAVRHIPEWLPVSAALARQSPQGARELLRHIIRLRTLHAELPQLWSAARGAVLLDEGPVFSLAVVSRACEAMPVPELVRYFDASVVRWGRALDIVVSIDAPDRVLARRINARPRFHRIKGRSDTEIRDFLAWYRRQYRRLTVALSARGVRVLHISSADDAAEAIALRVLAAIAGTNRAE